MTTSQAYNHNNQLCWTANTATTNGCSAPPSGAATYTYDANGNQLTGGPGGNYSYDNKNRLSLVAATSLGYFSPTNGELTSYGATSYFNNALGLAGQINGTTKVFYVRDPSGRPVAQRRYNGTTPQGTDRFLSDNLGSTTGLINGTSLTRSYAYDPDGNPTTTGTGPTTDLKYTASHTLPNGLIHNGARYYNPTTARWTQTDPLDQIGDLQQANRYAYVGNDPVNAVDLTGLEAKNDRYQRNCKKKNGRCVGNGGGVLGGAKRYVCVAAAGGGGAAIAYASSGPGGVVIGGAAFAAAQEACGDIFG